LDFTAKELDVVLIRLDTIEEFSSSSRKFSFQRVLSPKKTVFVSLLLQKKTVFVSLNYHFSRTSINMVRSLLVDGLSKNDDCNEATVTGVRSNEDSAVVSPEKERSRYEELAMVPTEKKQWTRDEELEADDDNSFNKALAAHPDPIPGERKKKDGDEIESFLVASFKNDDVQAMRDDTVECIYESLQGRLGFFCFKKRGLIDHEDGFSAQISYAIRDSCPPFDEFNMMVPVSACQFPNMNMTVKNAGDGFTQMRSVMVEDSKNITKKCAAQMVKVS
jgi:hypothetical protein